jgi:CDGSH-type Zn-finger protein
MPPVNTARLWQDGPVEYRGDLHIAGGEPRKRAVLCRCGQSGNKPYCDNSHIAAGFEATGEGAADEQAPALELRNGPVTITPAKNGPLAVEGSLEIIAASGRRLATKTKAFMCRCGASANRPYCDGSHKKIGFEAD